MTTVKPSRGGWIKRKPARGTNSAYWSNPETRDKMLAISKAGNAAMYAARKLNPAKFSRCDIPNGMTRETAAPLWADARHKADRYIKQMQDEGELPQGDFKVPETDELKGVAALHEATVLALGPGDKQAKLAAIRTVLEWTKAKPATRQKIDVTTSEDWLAEIAADDAS